MCKERRERNCWKSAQGLFKTDMRKRCSSMFFSYSHRTLTHLTQARRVRATRRVLCCSGCVRENINRPKRETRTLSVATLCRGNEKIREKMVFGSYRSSAVHRANHVRSRSCQGAQSINGWTSVCIIAFHLKTPHSLNFSLSQTEHS